MLVEQAGSFLLAGDELMTLLQLPYLQALISVVACQRPCQ